MTYVGKILVIVIMIFAIAFLSLSTMVFMTERDYKQATDKLKRDVSTLNGEKATLKQEVDKLTNDLVAAEKVRTNQVAELTSKVNTLDSEVKTRQAAITDMRKQIETALQNVKSSQDNSEAKNQDAAKAREILDAVQKEATAFKLQQLELKDRIRVLERELEQAQDNNKKLRNNNLTFQEIIRSNGLNDDPAYHQRRNRPLPKVDGEVLQVDARNQRIQISIGRDDGIDTPDELYVYRLGAKPEYLGKVRVSIADNDQATATVLGGNTVSGKKIREGDIVSTEIRTR